MIRLRRIIFATIAIFVITFQLGIMPLADDDTIGSIPITTSNGTDIEILNQNQAHNWWNSSEISLQNAISRMQERKAELNVLIKGFNGDTIGLGTILVEIGATLASGGNPTSTITREWVNSIINMSRRGERKALYLKVLEKYAEIDALNTELANKFSDRNKFHDAFEQFQGSESDFLVQGELSAMQLTIPHLNVMCQGDCGNWWYNAQFQTAALANPQSMGVVLVGTDLVSNRFQGSKVGLRVETSELATYATSHQTTCDGCSDPYWTCRPTELKEHQVLYCGLEIELYFSVPYTPSWTNKLGICGESYRRCGRYDKKGSSSVFC